MLKTIPIYNDDGKNNIKLISYHSWYLFLSRSSSLWLNWYWCESWIIWISVSAELLGDFNLVMIVGVSAETDYESRECNSNAECISSLLRLMLLYDYYY